jgi:hypothetical protein
MATDARPVQGCQVGGGLLPLDRDPIQLLVLLRDALRLLADQRVTRILRQRRIGHGGQPSTSPQAAATQTRGWPPKRDQRLPNATQMARA